MKPSSKDTVLDFDQVVEVQRSFDAIWSARKQFAKIFYDRLFEIAPHLRAMFPDDMESQHLKLMNMIAMLVGTLQNPALFQSCIDRMGRHHMQFGVTDSDFAVFEEALLSALSRQLAPKFSPECRNAWAALYEAIQSDMYGMQE